MIAPISWRLPILFGATLLCAGPLYCGDLRVGIIGLDTSHVIEFTKLLNDPDNPNHVKGARVVAAYPGGSPDLKASASRIGRFTGELVKQYKITICEDIPALCRMVDVVLLESVDGRKHLAQAEPVFRAHKRVFIDKPLAASLADAAEIQRLGRETSTPWFSASSVRFTREFASLAGDERFGGILGAASFGPAHLEPTNPGLLWYGIHAVEALYTAMGVGCESVTCTSTDGYDLVTGVWKDGRIGTVRGIRKGKQDFGVLVFGSKSIQYAPLVDDTYVPLVREIVRFFQTGEPPVSNRETLETIAFMDAAEQSRRRGGVPVKLNVAWGNP